jgi:peptidoglycan-associated lipoprotein
MENLMNSFNRVALMASLTTALFLGACSSTPVAAPAAPVAAAAPAVVEAAPAPAAPKAVNVAPTAMRALPAYLDPANALSTSRSVYFDFDKSAVKPEGLGVLELHGKYLAANPGVSIKVEGNADERGGAEYNLALGQKRADAVVKVLKTFGVKDSQLEAVSYGKEKPKATGHDEKSYAENRRGDLAYPSK